MVRLYWPGLLVAWAGLFPLPTFADPGPGDDFMSFPIVADADDGTEVNRRYWYADGYAGSDLNRMGRGAVEVNDLGLRFLLPDVEAGTTFVYARLVLPGTGDGELDAEASLRIVGIDGDGVPPFSASRPSTLPKTTAGTAWRIVTPWPAAQDGEDSPGFLLLRYSPDIAAIVNEIVGRTTWGTGVHGKTLGLVIEDRGSAGVNYLTVEDFPEASDDPLAVPHLARLELYRTLASTFVARELLGRPSGRAVTVNAMSLLTLQVYFEWGTVPGMYLQRTLTRMCPGGIPFDLLMNGLAPDTQYYYRMRYRRPGMARFESGPEYTFHTQRLPGSSFRFTIAADSHIWESMRQGTSQELYWRTVALVADDKPDFHIDLGDTFFCEDYTAGDVRDFEDAVVRHLAQRPFLDEVCHSAPLFCVLGNHEGEQGWRLDGTPDNVAVWAAKARKLLYLNPVPNGFYTGCQQEIEFVGLPENYYAFEWGNALFVILDPYWYTMTKPHGAGGSPGSDDNWDWTLGFTQYDWLRNTLEDSTATFKLVFCHQVVGGADYYGRGGIEAASHQFGGFGSYEWGGEDVGGAYAFGRFRLGWGMPIHQLLVDNGVTIFFHGHDHVFCKQELDGVVYQECPQPANAMYGAGQFAYRYGDLVNNSGYLRVSVSPAALRVQYVRSYLPGDGVHGRISYDYVVEAR